MLTVVIIRVASGILARGSRGLQRSPQDRAPTGCCCSEPLCLTMARADLGAFWLTLFLLAGVPLLFSTSFGYLVLACLF